MAGESCCYNIATPTPATARRPLYVLMLLPSRTRLRRTKERMSEAMCFEAPVQGPPHADLPLLFPSHPCCHSYLLIDHHVILIIPVLPPFFQRACLCPTVLLLHSQTSKIALSSLLPSRRPPLFLRPMLEMQTPCRPPHFQSQRMPSPPLPHLPSVAGAAGGTGPGSVRLVASEALDVGLQHSVPACYCSPSSSPHS